MDCLQFDFSFIITGLIVLNGIFLTGCFLCSLADITSDSHLFCVEHSLVFIMVMDYEGFL